MPGDDYCSPGRGTLCSAMLSFHVPGVPAPQGSKTPWGSEANPRTRPWRAAVAAEAALMMGNDPLILDPVKVIVHFYFPRPKSHYRTGKHADVLKDTAPVYHTGHPDLDKLQRAIGDALTGTVIRDDKQIASWGATKAYYSGVMKPGAYVHVVPLPREERHGTHTSGADSPDLVLLSE